MMARNVAALAGAAVLALSASAAMVDPLGNHDAAFVVTGNHGLA